MLLNIQLPAWLIDLWGVYGDVITPILITLLSAVVTWLALRIKTDGKLRLAQATEQIKALESVANKNNDTKAIDDLNAKIELAQTSINYLADMLFVFF
jgi:hypothetical protein